MVELIGNKIKRISSFFAYFTLPVVVGVAMIGGFVKFVINIDKNKFDNAKSLTGIILEETYPAKREYCIDVKLINEKDTMKFVYRGQTGVEMNQLYNVGDTITFKEGYRPGSELREYSY